MTATRGDVEALRDATARMQAANRRLGGPIADYRFAVQRLHAASSELEVAVVARAGRIEQIRTTLDAVGTQPAMFATALALADRAIPGPPSGPAVPPGHGPGGAGLLRLIAEDPVEAHARHRQGERLAIELRDLLREPDDVRAGYDRIATLLQQLAAADDLMLAAAFAELGPGGVLGVLRLIREAHLLDDAHGSHGERVLDPTTDLLAPMTSAFERATGQGLVGTGFAVALTAGVRAEPGDGWRTHDRVREDLLVLGQLFVHGDPFAPGDAQLTAAFAAVVMHPSFEEATRPLWHGMTTYWHPITATGGFDTFSPDGLVADAAIALAADPAAAARFLGDDQTVRHLLVRAEQSWHWPDDRAALPSEVLQAGLLVHPLHEGVFDGPLGRHGDYATALRSVIAEVLHRDRAAANLTGGLATILAPHRDAYLGLSQDHTPEQDVLLLADDDARRYLTIVMSGEPGESAATEVMATWSATLIEQWGASIVPLPGEAAISPMVASSVSSQLNAHRDLLDRFEAALGDANTRHLDGLGFRFAVIDEADRLLRSQVLRQAGFTGGVKGRLASHVLGEVGSSATGRLKGWMIDAGPTEAGDHRGQLDARLEQLAIRTLVDRLPSAEGAYLPVGLGPRDVEVEVAAGGVAGFFGSTVTATETRPFGQWDAAALTAWRAETVRVLQEEHGLSPREVDAWWLAPILGGLTN